MIKKIISLFKKEEKLFYPYEYAEVVTNENAFQNGISDKGVKNIIRYRYNKKTREIEEYKTYGYSDSLIWTLRNKLKIPVYYSEDESDFPEFSEFRLDEINYEK